MAFMPWTEQLQVGIAEIDEQHRWLVDQTNALHDAMQGSARPEQVGELLEGLMDYTMNLHRRGDAIDPLGPPQRRTCRLPP